MPEDRVSSESAGILRLALSIAGARGHREIRFSDLWSAYLQRGDQSDIDVLDLYGFAPDDVEVPDVAARDGAAVELGPTKDILSQALRRALSRGHPHIAPRDLLDVLLELRAACDVPGLATIDIEALRLDLLSVRGSLVPPELANSLQELGPSRQLELLRRYREATGGGASLAASSDGSALLLLLILAGGGPIADVLTDHGIDRRVVLDLLDSFTRHRVREQHRR